MKPIRLKVVNVRWFDEESKQSSVELETPNGQQFICFCDGYKLSAGQEVEAEGFIYLDTTGLFDEVFNSNPGKEKKLIRRNGEEWNYDVKGQIVEVQGDTLWVDCGSLVLPLDSITSDTSVKGEWIGFSVERLEVEIKQIFTNDCSH